jgi:hypothetical protein
MPRKPYFTTFTGEEELGAQSLIYSVLVCDTETHPPKRMGCSLLSRLLVLHLSSTRKEKESLKIRHISF